MIRDLRIENYRSFLQLNLSGIAQVNLVVGMNNSGKTSLLEAIYLLASKGDFASLFEILRSRGEMVLSDDTIPHLEVSRGVNNGCAYTLSYVFYQDSSHVSPRHSTAGSNTPRIVIASGAQQVTIGVGKGRSGIMQENLFPDQLTDARLTPAVLSLTYATGGGPPQPGEQDSELRMSADLMIPDYFFRSPRVNSPNRFVATGHTSYLALANLWDHVTLTPKEETVIAALQIIEPRVERISFTSGRTAGSGILMKVSDQEVPIPLGTLGDGMRRILGLAINAVSAEGGELLVDEVDTGLYYRVQTDMWRLLLGISRRQNVQIFATTHSLDCIQAFQRAVSLEGEGTDASVIRLDAINGATKSTFYSPAELEIAVQEEIEVR